MSSSWWTEWMGGGSSSSSRSQSFLMQMGAAAVFWYMWPVAQECLESVFQRSFTTLEINKSELPTIFDALVRWLALQSKQQDPGRRIGLIKNPPYWMCIMQHWWSCRSSTTTKPFLMLESHLLTNVQRQRDGGPPIRRMHKVSDMDNAVVAPGNGQHILHWRDRWILIKVEDEGKGGGGGRGFQRLPHTIQLSYWGGKVGVLHELISEAVNEIEQLDANYVQIHSYEDGFWDLMGMIPRRPRNTLILDESVIELENDVQEFLDSEEWYHRQHVPYRRNYLIYGPPGSGKTSFLRYLAGKHHLCLAVLNVNRPFMNDSSLSNALSTFPNASLVVIEDVDCCLGDQLTGRAQRSGEEPSTATAPTVTSSSTSSFKEHSENITNDGVKDSDEQNDDDDVSDEDDDDDGDDNDRLKTSSDDRSDFPDGVPPPPSMRSKCKVTLSGLLNAIDGLSSAECRVIFMSTNHPEKLKEQAFMRKGRIDFAFEFRKSDSSHIPLHLLRFFPEMKDSQEFEEFKTWMADYASRFRARTDRQLEVSGSELQEIFVRNKKDQSLAIEALRVYIRKHFPLN